MKRIFTLGLVAALLLGGASKASAQKVKEDYTITGDLTSQITNADFSADAAIAIGWPKGEATVGLATYDYDMPDDGIGAGGENIGRFGMQPITGWTASVPSDNIKGGESSQNGGNAKAGGIFAYNDAEAESPIGLAGPYYAPTELEAEGITTSGKALGIVAVWSSEIQYTQDITLPAGTYMMVVKLCNTSGAGEIASRNGFVTSDGITYYSENKTFDNNTWTEDVIVFRLAEATSGQLSLGYKDPTNYGSGSAPHIYIDNVQLYTVSEDGVIIEETLNEINTLIENTLNPLLAEGEEVGADSKILAANYEIAEKTYDKTTITTVEAATQALADVNAAIESQREANKNAQVDLSAYFLKNAHFTEDEPITGGICTYGKDMKTNTVTHYGMLPVSQWTASHPCDLNVTPDNADPKDNPNDGRACGVFSVGSSAFLGGKGYNPPATLSDGSTEGNVLGFVGCWSAKSQYTQKVSLPAGQYTLKISFYNSGGASAVANNLMGFVEDGGTQHFGTTKQWAVGKWITERISFELTEPTSGYFSVGYEATNSGSGAMPHFFIDGISISFVGDLPMDPTQLGLAAAIENAENAFDSNFYTELRTQLETAVGAGQKLLDDNSTDETVNKAAADAITALMADVTASIEAYKALDLFYNGDGENPSTFSKARDKYDATTYPDLAQALNDYEDELMEATNDYNWDTETVNAKMAYLNTIIKEGVQKAWTDALATIAGTGQPLANDLDISGAFDQMSYTYSTETKQGSAIPDKEWSYGSASNFKTTFGTAEVWNQSPFEVSRTLKDLPAGTYTFTTKGFYRVAKNADNHTKGEEDALEDKVFLFVGSNVKTPLLNNYALEQSTALDGWVEPETDLGVYVPNTQGAAYAIFEDDSYTEQVQRSVQIAITEPGDLTFGIKADKMESESWAVWYGFTLTYNAVNANVLNDELADYIEEVQEYWDNNNPDAAGDAGMNRAGSTTLEAAITAANKKLGAGVTAEDKSAALKTLQEAYAKALKNQELWANYQDAVKELEDAHTNYYASATTTAQDKYDDLNNKIASGHADDLDNEALEAFIDEVKAAAAALRIKPGYETASDSNPVDMTYMISNPSFEDENMSAWSWNTKASDAGRKSIGEAGTTYYIDNYTAGSANYIELKGDETEEYLFNIWNSGGAPEGGFFLKQTIQALPAGTYEVKAFFTANGKEQISGNHWICLSANENAGVYPIECLQTTAQPQSVIFQVASGEDVVIQANSDNWFKADHFTLTYYGAQSKKEATAIEDIDAAAAPAKSKAIYNFAGQRVDASYKGFVIKNGRKYLQR